MATRSSHKLCNSGKLSFIGCSAKAKIMQLKNIQDVVLCVWIMCVFYFISLTMKRALNKFVFCESKKYTKNIPW